MNLPTWNRLTSALLLAISPLGSIAATANEEKVIYSFAGGQDGSYPTGPLIRDSSGNLYGTTSNGGRNCDCGTVFRVTPDGKKTTLYTFAGGNDGADPNGGLVMDSKGNFYGTTSQGGGNFGTIFKIFHFATSSNGSEKILHSFDGSDGRIPEFGLTIDHNGNLYGTTLAGGQYGGGTAFRLGAGGQFKVLHAFGDDGASPTTFLSGADNAFYSTTVAGGEYNSGTVFKMTKKGKVSVLYTFGSEDTGGVDPTGYLVQDSGGVLYGTTVYGGGMNNDGTVFSLKPDGTETMLHSFAGGDDGVEPSGGLVIDGQRNLYGVTSFGGPGTNCFGNGCGTIFKVASDGTVTIIYAFTGGHDGSNPTGPLIKDGGNGFYGATAEGGVYGYGTIFWLQN